MPSNLEELLLRSLEENGLPIPIANYFFHLPYRRWKFDFAYPEAKIAIEVEGGTWVRGRHITPVGYGKDCIKYNVATILGWSIIRLTGDHIKSGHAYRLIDYMIRSRIELPLIEFNEYTKGLGLHGRKPRRKNVGVVSVTEE